MTDVVPVKAEKNGERTFVYSCGENDTTVVFALNVELGFLPAFSVSIEYAVELARKNELKSGECLGRNDLGGVTTVVFEINKGTKMHNNAVKYIPAVAEAQHVFLMTPLDLPQMCPSCTKAPL